MAKHKAPADPTVPTPAPAAPTKKPRKKALPKAAVVDASSDIEVTEGAKRPPRKQVNWVKNPQWTDKLIEYLTDHPSFRKKLFSDSTADAKKEERTKEVAKDGKAVQCGVLAKHIFENDNKEQARYANDPAKFAGTVETRLRRLKKEYIFHLHRVGATGAGLDPDRVRGGSELASVFDEVRKAFPWWDELHAFWRELPNYNPIGVQSSEPGVDHAGAAADIFAAQAGSEEEKDLDPDAAEQDDDEDGRSDWSKAQDPQPEDTGGDDYSISSTPDSEDNDDDLVITAPPKTAAPAAPAKTPRQLKPKVPPATNGRDLGLAKAKATNTSAAAKKKPQNALDRMNDLREAESVRLAEKRQLQHTEEMERLANKKMKLKLKLLQAENERTRLNRRLSIPF
ncbi:hypothetical protein DFH07DRAFT_963795 [Mycena maculata]|uniref:Uncharacterized protein n=1 Tax=Mycena maculata TaxID=230809 RepID=A0AAD7IJ00_9AGAR|nr:hypothetical protein DFH07DRAFT_963795 [Mycena maculata]